MLQAGVLAFGTRKSRCDTFGAVDLSVASAAFALGFLVAMISLLRRIEIPMQCKSWFDR